MSRRRTSPLAGEHVLITGGSSGIGLAFAKSLVERNANVTLVARDAAKLAAAASSLRELDCRKMGVDPWVCTRVADVTDAKQVQLERGTRRVERASGLGGAVP